MSQNFQENRLLSELTTFGIGGPAKFYIEVHDISQVKDVMKFCKAHALPYYVLGKGSNCLFDDRGFDGVIIGNRIDFMNDMGNGLFHAGAGYSFSLLGNKTARQGWTGLEFASGIPGSVGGAVFMNAGANGKETCESLVAVEVVNENGEVVKFQRSALDFGYRTSTFQRHNFVIVSASFQLITSKEAREKQLGIIQYRTKTQPYNAKSAGCVFRNPSSILSAGALIDQSGLKGKTIGGASVSTVHANFLINSGGATAQDMLKLMDFVKDEVKKKTGIELENEVRVVPYSTKVEMSCL